MRRPDILIVGQGLAGTLLGWELERAGVDFAIVDGGHASAATSVAAGIVNPITGRRLAKSWRFDEFLPLARASYGAIENVLGVSLWHEMRVRRLFADDAERTAGASPQRQADLATFIESTDESGWWIRGAARVELATLLHTSRAHWLKAGRLRPGMTTLHEEAPRHLLVIDCRGLAGAESPDTNFVPWEFSKGEALELEIDGLDPDVILNRRMWILPLRPGAALAGATHDTGAKNRCASEAGRAAIETATRAIVGDARRFVVTGHRAGVRVNVPDKRPVAGRHPSDARVGLMNGLGGKGALWAPVLAIQWAKHLTAGAPFDAEIDVGRFGASERQATR